MEDLIKQVFLNVDIVGRDVHDGHYDLIGPDEGIILPQFWESVVQPGCTVTMRISTPPPGSNSIPNESIRSSGGEYDTAKYEICFATKYKNFDTQIGEIVASLVDNGFNPTFGMKPSNRSPPKLSGALLWEPSAMRNGSELHESLWQNGWMPVYMRGSRMSITSSYLACNIPADAKFKIQDKRGSMAHTLYIRDSCNPTTPHKSTRLLHHPIHFSS